MLRLALLSARGRLGTFAGAFVALAASSALVMAGGMPLESALRSHPPVERYAGAAAVVTGQQIVGVDHDVPLGERARVDSALTARLAAVPGVRAAIADVSVPARLGGRDSVAHGWSSARAHAVRAERRPRARRTRRGRHRLPRPRSARGCGSRPPTGARTVTVVGVARPRHAVAQQTAIFLTDDEAPRLAGHPGRVDAIGVLAGPGFDASRLRAASHGAVVYTGDARGKAEHPELLAAKTTLIAVTASFGGLALFIAIFVVTSTMGLSIQQREREIALLRAVAGDARPDPPHDRVGGRDRRPRRLAGRALAGSHARRGARARRSSATTSRRRTSPSAPAGCRSPRPSRGGVLAALLAVLGAGRRAARVPPTHALTQAAVEPRLLGPGRVIGGLVALAGADAAVRRLDHDRLSGDGRGDVGDDRALPRGGGRLPGTARGARRRRDPRAAARAARAGRRLPRLGEPAHRHAALLVGQHAAGAHRRDELHAAVQHDHPATMPSPRSGTRACRASSRSPAPDPACRPRRWPMCAPRPACARRSA